MRTLTTQKKWQPWKGILLQVGAFGMLLTAGSFLQRNLGYIGLILSELLFGVLAVTYTLAKKTPLKEVFPVRKLTVRDFFGTVFMWAGSLGFGFISVYLASAVLTDTFFKVLSSINDALTFPHPLLSFLTVAVIAPICEEAIERGAVFSHFRSWKKEWAVMLIIGIFFGIMHTDPIRFLNTTIMGAAAAYLMIKKDNFLLPLMLHFTTNALGSVVGAFRDAIVSEDAVSQLMENYDPLMSLGAGMMLFCAAPFGIAAGVHLLSPRRDPNATREEQDKRFKKLERNYIIATVITCLLFIGGLILMIITPTFNKMQSDMMSKIANGLIICLL